MATTVEHDRERAPEAASDTDISSSTGVSDSDLIESVRRSRGREPAEDTKTAEKSTSVSLSSLFEKLSSGFSVLGGGIWSYLSGLVEKLDGEGEGDTRVASSRRSWTPEAPKAPEIERDREQVAAPVIQERSGPVFASMTELDEELEEKQQWHLSEALKELSEAERRENEQEEKEKKLVAMLSVEKEALGITNPQQLAAKLKEISARVQEYALETGEDMRAEADSMEAVQEILRRWQVLEDRLSDAGVDLTGAVRKDRRDTTEPAAFVSPAVTPESVPSTEAPSHDNGTREAPPMPVSETLKRPSDGRQTLASLDRLMTSLERTADELLASRTA